MRSPLHPRDDRGVVAIEFVLVLPFLLVLIVISISLAGLFQTKSRVVGAARDGARALAIKPGVASPSADTNATDGITVVLEGAACPALTNPAYQTANPPQVTAKASTTFTVDIPFVGTWPSVGVIERVSMPCG
jgi:Flp pilus assembly protein TadG